MLKGQILEVEDINFKDGSVRYKTLVSVQFEKQNILQRVYSDKKCNLGSFYEIKLTGSDDLKTIKVKIGNEIINSVENSDKKGIFNK